MEVCKFNAVHEVEQNLSNNSAVIEKKPAELKNKSLQSFTS